MSWAISGNELVNALDWAGPRAELAPVDGHRGWLMGLLRVMAVNHFFQTAISEPPAVNPMLIT